MDIRSAIQQYLVGQKEIAPRAQVEFEIAVLGRLEGYLADEITTVAASELRSADLLAFVRNWYREGDAVTPETAQRLMGAIVGFARWLDRQFAPAIVDAPPLSPRPGVALELASLEQDLPRAAQAAEALRRYARREDLAPQLEVETEESRSPLGLLTGGATRVMRPAEVDYARAEEDTFQVTEVGECAVALLSPARVQLGEGPATPVAVPAAVARLLRVGDILHVEIAPTATGWEILHLETVYPGGLDDRP
jgi:hypothetical protein